MHDKNIKLNVRKQLKKQYPNWRRLGKKLKKEIARKVVAEAEAKYDFEQAIDEMARYIDMINDNKIIKFSSYNRSPIYQR